MGGGKFLIYDTNFIIVFITVFINENMSKSQWVEQKKHSGTIKYDLYAP